MITPFGPPDEDLNRLNTILDAQVTGKRAPETDPASDADVLATAARLVAGTPLDAKEHASVETLDSIWRNIMHAHAIPGSTHITGTQPSAVRSSRSRPSNPGPHAVRSSSWFSIAAVAILLLGIVGGAWTMRGGSGGGPEPIRLAAVAPLGTPGDESPWLTWIQPKECTLEPMRPSKVARLQSESGIVSVPEYGHVSEPSRVEAEGVAVAARALTACFMYRSDGNYSSKQYLWLYTSPNSPLASPEARVEHQESDGRAVSRDLNLRPADLLVTTKVQPNQIQQEMPVVYLPEQAVQFEDGRIGIPISYLSAKDDPYEVPQALYTTLVVFSNEAGAWLLDDSLSICVGECEAYIDGGPWIDNGILTTSNGIATASPVASPVATPEG